MKKDIKAKAPLDQAIETLQGAIDDLDEMIAEMQANQALLRSWLEPGPNIGWMENNDDKK
jgi:hypothetical protein